MLCNKKWKSNESLNNLPEKFEKVLAANSRPRDVALYSRVRAIFTDGHNHLLQVHSVYLCTMRASSISIDLPLYRRVQHFLFYGGMNKYVRVSL